MIRVWSNFTLIFLLALLQGVAPLLHAHVFEVSIPNKIHVDGLEIEVPYQQVDPGVHQLNFHSDESKAIGMETAGKNNQEEMGVSAPTQGLVSMAFAMLPATAPPLLMLLTAIRSPLPNFYLLPPPQAPPATNPR